MKRNWDVIRKILIQVEALPSEDDTLGSDAITGVIPELAAYHMRLLIEAGLLEGGCRNATAAPWCYVSRMTWAGHEFLDAVRRDTIWNKLREMARDRCLDLSFEVIKGLSSKVLEDLL